MRIKEAKFVKSSTDYQASPKPDKPEYAFIGRSNVGKSSLINRLTNRSNLAKTSQKPGKTQLINHFLINESWYLVDLPGYGWAKVGKNKRHSMSVMIHDYLVHRKNLHCVFTLIDSRLEPQEIDLDFMRFLGESEIPFVMVFTKVDKQRPETTQKNIVHYHAKMHQEWEELPPYFVSSSLSGEGCEEILAYIYEINQASVRSAKK